MQSFWHSGFLSSNISTFWMDSFLTGILYACVACMEIRFHHRFLFNANVNGFGLSSFGSPSTFRICVRLFHSGVHGNVSRFTTYTKRYEKSIIHENILFVFIIFFFPRRQSCRVFVYVFWFIRPVTLFFFHFNSNSLYVKALTHLFSFYVIHIGKFRTQNTFHDILYEKGK